MKLTLVQLEAHFVRYESRMGEVLYATGKKMEAREYHVHVETLSEAQGVQFLCPTCLAKNNGPEGTHTILCWSRSRGTPDSASPGPGRWLLVGTGLHDLTLNGEPGHSRSVALTSSDCKAHFFVDAGAITPV